MSRVLAPTVMTALVSLLPGCGPSVGDGGGSGDDVVDAAVDAEAATAFDASARIDAADRVDAGPLADAALPVNCGVLPVVYRDFQASHPDFEEAESKMGSDRGIVATALGADKRPAYAHVGATKTVTSPGSFSQWYNTDPQAEINREVQDTVRLLEHPTRPGVFVFEDTSFFPVNGRGFETSAASDNFGFTTEIHATFRYLGGERFTFQGDDDLFVFVNGRLAIDLGGVHTPEEGIIDFDARAAELGLTRGTVYPLDIFHAERHTVQSNFYVETTIECFLPPVD
jgi:fibro-slime domain-containing protein